MEWKIILKIWNKKVNPNTCHWRKLTNQNWLTLKPTNAHDQFNPEQKNIEDTRRWVEFKRRSQECKEKTDYHEEIGRAIEQSYVIALIEYWKVGNFDGPQQSEIGRTFSERLLWDCERKVNTHSDCGTITWLFLLIVWCVWKDSRWDRVLRSQWPQQEIIHFEVLPKKWRDARNLSSHNELNADSESQSVCWKPLRSLEWKYDRMYKLQSRKWTGWQHHCHCCQRA